MSGGTRELDIMFEISQILNTGLNKKTLVYLKDLCDSGCNSEALAHVVRQLRSKAKEKKGGAEF